MVAGTRRRRQPGRIARRSMASCSCSGQVFAGTTCRRGWASARARPAGVVWTHGRRRAVGTSCMRCCSTSCTNPGNWTFRMLPSILPPCELLERAKNRAKPDGSCGTRFEAPHSRRRQRSAGQCDLDTRKPSRRHSTAASGRRHTPDLRHARQTTSQPKVIDGGRDYDSDTHRQRLHDRCVRPLIARRRTEHDSGLGKFRWVVERTRSWLHNLRRLGIRFDRRADIHEAFLKLGCALVCWNISGRTA